MVQTCAQRKKVLRAKKARLEAELKEWLCVQKKWWQKERNEVLETACLFNECPTCHTEKMIEIKWDEIYYKCGTCGLRHVMWRIPLVMKYGNVIWLARHR